MYVFVLPPALFSLQYNDHAQLKYMITFYVVESLQTESPQADHYVMNTYTPHAGPTITGLLSFLFIWAPRN